MKAREWEAKFRACKSLDEIVDVADEYVGETVQLFLQRKNYSAIREQKQKWRAMRLFPDHAFDTLMNITCTNERGQLAEITDEEFVAFAGQLSSILGQK